MQNQDNKFEWSEWNPTPSNNTSENDSKYFPQENTKNLEFKEQNLNEVDNNHQNQNQVNFKWNDYNNHNDQLDQNPKESQELNNDSNENNGENLPFSVIGKTDELYYHGYLYNLNCDNNKIKDELKTIPLNIKEKDGRYEFNPQEGSELGNFIKSLLECSTHEHNLRIIDCNVIKCEPNESFLNIFSGKPPFNFLYVAQSNDNVGEIVLDFSAMGGPSFNTRKYEEGSLILIPGWVPYRISKNNSQQDHILIAGMLG